MNIFQQWGRREDYPFTYFGMYKEGRLETKAYYRFKIIYVNDQTEIDISTLGIDHYYMRKKLRIILLNETYRPNNDAVNYGDGLLINKKGEIRKLFIKDILPQLTSKKLPLENSQLKLIVNYWDDLTPSTIHSPDKDFIYLQTDVSALMPKKGLDD